MRFTVAILLASSVFGRCTNVRLPANRGVISLPLHPQLISSQIRLNSGTIVTFSPEWMPLPDHSSYRLTRFSVRVDGKLVRSLSSDFPLSAVSPHRGQAVIDENALGIWISLPGIRGSYHIPKEKLTGQWILIE